MKLIVKDRGMGKTIELIHVSEATGYPIAVSTEMHRRCIIDKAKELKCNIPQPTLIEYAKCYEHVLVDEITMGGILSKAVNEYLGTYVVACTCSPDYSHEEYMKIGKEESCLNRGFVITC